MANGAIGNIKETATDLAEEVGNTVKSVEQTTGGLLCGDPQVNHQLFWVTHRARHLHKDTSIIFFLENKLHTKFCFYRHSILVKACVKRVTGSRVPPPNWYR